jgi:hypothetical protein
VTEPSARCLVQPAGSVALKIGCHGKTMVAHEDEHRPQKAKFIRNFQYTLKKGRGNQN